MVPIKDLLKNGAAVGGHRGRWFIWCLNFSSTPPCNFSVLDGILRSGSFFPGRIMTTKFGRLRASFVELDLEQLPGNLSRATVTLAFQGRQYVGRAGRSGEVRCAAEATGDALRRLVGTERSAFEILDLQSLTVLDVPAVIVALSVRWQNESRTLAGFSLTSRDGLPHAAVRAVLSSTNRFLEWLWDTQEVSPAAAS